CARRGAYW
nr:immunoglobulin heavy chain junction region [Mus musculus]